LPTWDDTPFAPLLAGLSPGDRQGVEDYLRLQPIEKALALAPGGGVYWQDGEFHVEDARDRALAYCRKQAKVECSLAAENFSPINQSARQVQARR
jgi:hypothetical protein